MNFSSTYANLLQIFRTTEYLMETRWSPEKCKVTLLSSVNFILSLVILFCGIYLYIDFLFR